VLAGAVGVVVGSVDVDGAGSVGVALADVLLVLDGLAVPEDLAVVADGFVLPVGLVAVDPDVAVVAWWVGEADVLPLLALMEMVGDSLCDGGRSGVGEALRDEDGPDEDGLDVEDAGLEVADVGLEVVGVSVGAVGAGLGAADEDVAVGVAGGLGDSEGSCSASHDCLLAGGAAAFAAAARLTPETAVSRRLPATRATAAGRGCANRMKRLPLLLATARNGSLDYRQSYPVGSDVHSLGQRGCSRLGATELLTAWGNAADSL